MGHVGPIGMPVPAHVTRPSVAVVMRPGLGDGDAPDAPFGATDPTPAGACSRARVLLASRISTRARIAAAMGGQRVERRASTRRARRGHTKRLAPPSADRRSRACRPGECRSVRSWRARREIPRSPGSLDRSSGECPPIRSLLRMRRGGRSTTCRRMRISSTRSIVEHCQVGHVAGDHPERQFGRGGPVLRTFVSVSGRASQHDGLARRRACFVGERRRWQQRSVCGSWRSRSPASSSSVGSSS
jgi:hypothetical protein